jgi:AcrR family transcriptional regulator
MLQNAVGILLVNRMTSQLARKQVMKTKNSQGFDASENAPNRRAEGRKTSATRQRQILAAAFEEFAANGYAGARLDNLARRAKIAKGTIYLYFPSKSRLFQAVVRSLIRPVPEDFESRVKASSAPASQLLAELIGRQYSELVNNRKAREIVRLLIAESGKFPQLSELYQREVIDPGMRAIRLLIEKGLASGEFHATMVSAFPQMLAAPAVLAVVWILIFGERVSLDLGAYRNAHVQFAIASLHGDGRFAPAPKSTSDVLPGGPQP